MRRLSFSWAVPMGRSLGLGAAGGGLASLADVPLAWMLGAMAANVPAALAGWDLRVPQGFRRAMLAVAGVYIGAGFSPESAGQLAAAPGSLALMARVCFAGDIFGGGGVSEVSAGERGDGVLFGDAGRVDGGDCAFGTARG